MRLPRQCRRDHRMGGRPKKCFRTEAEALDHVGRGENAYYCTHCGNYHVGHEPGTKFGDKPGGRR